MTQIILDTSIASKLNALNHPVELCDPSGQVLGRFVPRIDLSEWEPISPDITEDELERRAKSKEKRYTTAEVLSHLERYTRLEFDLVFVSHDVERAVSRRVE